MLDVILKRFDTPDETREFELGRFTIGATQCTVEHVGLVVSGHATAAMKDGTVHPSAR